jgi:hypothetical protein
MNLAAIRAAAGPRPPTKITYAPNCHPALLDNALPAAYLLAREATQAGLWRDYAIGFARGSARK